MLTELLACAVCYGDPDSPLTQGANMGITVLLGVTGFVLTCFGYFFVSIWRKSARVNKSRND